MASTRIAALTLVLALASASVEAVAQEPAAQQPAAQDPAGPPGAVPPPTEERVAGPPAPEAPEDENVAAIEAFLGEGVVAVVGRELIRRNDVVAAFESDDYGQEIAALRTARRSSDPRVREQGHLLVLIEILRDHLKAEGGRNQGYAPEMIAAILSQRMSELQRNAGGPVAASQWLRQWGFDDPESYNERNESLLLRQTWERSVTGRAPGPTGRPDVDRYVAPGLLHLEYQKRLESRSAEDRATVGEQPQRYVLEQVVLGIIEYRGIEAAEAVAEVIQAEVRAGTLTMEAAAREFTRPETWVSEWRAEPLSEAQIQSLSRGRYDGTAMAEWVLGASPGDVSAPFMLKLADKGVLKPAALVVFRLAEILPATGAAPLRDTALQARLRDGIQTGWDEARVERALVDLLEATYVVPLELRSGLLREARRGAKGAPDGPGAR